VGVLIDTSLLVAAERGHTALALAGGSEEVALAAITASELLHGVYRADSTARRVRRQAFVEGLLAAVEVVPFDLPVARVHAELQADLGRRGIRVGSHDLLIAATALARGDIVATLDRRSFSRIPDLEVLVLEAPAP